MNKIVTRLVKAGLMLDMKNLLRELRAPKLKPIKADKGMQGVKIFNIDDNSSVVSVERVVEHEGEEA